jgi:hypothetical protein
MSDKNSIVAVYETYSHAEAGVKELLRGGVDLASVSLAGKEHHTKDDVVGYYDSGDRLRYWGKMEPFWGKLWGLLSGGAFFELPLLGPVLIAGPLAGAVVAGLERGTQLGDLSALGVGLFNLGIPRNRIPGYENRLMTGNLLLVMHGPAEEMMKARDVLWNARPHELNLHFAEEGVMANA